MKTIDGKYHVLKKLGQGFGGLVFLTEANGQKLALKQLRLDQKGLSPNEILENFKDEFSTLKELHHPHILRILDFGFDAKENFYYFTTEYIEGRDIFEATQDLSVEEIEELFVQTLRALSYLHGQWVYHLDIKPGNILVTENAQGQKIAKLIDFGLTAFKKKGVLAGSPAYIAPESFLEERRDGRADLYSLGVTWYECLTRENPFRADDLQKSLDRHRSWVPSPVSSLSPQIPSYLDPILEKLLKKNPSERYHRADQVIRDLNLSASRHYPLETEATALAYLPGEGQLVGRQAEWSQLLSFFDRVFLSHSESKACVILTGAPGTGKSRLLKELKYHAQLQTVPVLDLAETSFAQLKSDALLLADNADAETLHLAQNWIQHFLRHSILIVLAGTDLPSSSPVGHTITLRNFDRQEVSHYIASVLGMMAPPSFLVDELFSRTEGNPLFLTDLLHSLIGSHQMFDNQGRWSASLLKEVGIDFSQLQAPKTLMEYCENKYRRLTPDSQRILSLVALAKAPLDRARIVKLGLEVHKKEWEILQEENLIALDPSQGEIRLINPSFRDWILHHMEAPRIAALHQTLGDLFREDPHTQAAAWFHLGFGTRPPQERFHDLLQYGEALLLQNRWLDAAHAFEVASTLAAATENQVKGNLKKVQALFRAGHHVEALDSLQETQRILKKEKENPHRWRWVQQTFREMGNMYLKEGRLDLAHETLQASRVLLEEHEENPVEEMILDNFRASLLMREGKLKEASDISEETYRRWNSFPLEIRKQILNNELPSIYLALGKKEKAKALHQAFASFYEEIGHLPKRAAALYGWGESCYFLKQYEEAAEIFKSCVSLSRETKNEEILFHAFNGLGSIAYLREEWSQAAEYYQNALELAQHYAHLDSSVAIAINLAIVLRHQGDHSSAHLYLRHVIDTLEAQIPPSLHQLQFLIQGYLELGNLSLETSKWMQARDAFRDAVRLVRHHPALERFRFKALIGLAQSDLRLQQSQEAHAVLNELERGNLSTSEREELEEIKKL
jgi:serine/threonine protein kinase/tetratricopeptide (TPR) repeat protein